jgi:hypothetical protein
MKKLFILLLMVAVAFTLFAQEAEDDYTAIDQDAAEETGSGREFDVEITAGIPMHWTDGYDHPDDQKDKYVSQALSLGVALTYNFNTKFGITLDTDYAFVRFVGSQSNDAGVYDGYDGLFEANALLGAVVYLYNGNFLRIPLAFGIHYYYFVGPDYWPSGSPGGIAGTWVSATDHQFGPGAYLGLQFHFNKSLYILARTSVTVDVARYHTWSGYVNGAKDEDSEFELITSLHVKPTFGLGIKW